MVVVAPILMVVAEDEVTGECDMATTDNARLADVVVGVDAAESNVSALRWAADQAARSGSSLRLVYVINKSLLDSPYYSQSDLDRFVTTLMSRARAVAGEEHPDLEVHSDVVRGFPRSQLVETSQGASMLVVGRRGRGTFGELLLGSVAMSVATHARVPTAVIPHVWDQKAFSSDPLVIGVDENGASDEALAFAFEMARQRDVPLHAVQVVPAGEEFLRMQPAVTEPSDDHAKAVGALEAATASWQEKYPDVRLTCRPEWGHPVRALVDESVSAQMVILGGSRHGRLSAPLLGSVQHGLLHHAHCPVVVVHADAN
jgi:nucleotide-binding universal stress UspA family protein